MLPCTVQISSCLCALTGREEGGQVCLWYNERFLKLAFVQSPCYCFVATRSCEMGLQAEMAIHRLAELTLETKSFMWRMSDLYVSVISTAFGKGGKCGTPSACSLSAHYLGIALLGSEDPAAC